jgi:hypothetical protein
MLRLYEEMTGDRLRPPTTIDIEHRVKPALHRAFQRGELVRRGQNPAAQQAKQQAEGVHAKKPLF